MEQKIITHRQAKALEFITAAPFARQYYFSGGTALAEYYLHHRLSEDLDFFSVAKVPGKEIVGFVDVLGQHLGASKITYSKTFERHIFILTFPDGDLKMEFTWYEHRPIGRMATHNDIKVDSFRDLAVNKLMALIDRFEPKDFVDLYFILKKRPLRLIQNDLVKKFGFKIDRLTLAAEFSKVERIHSLPRMVRPLSIGELKDFFGGQIKKIGKLLTR